MSQSGRRRRALAFGIVVSGLAIASALGATDLDAFAATLQTVAERYASVSRTVLPSTVAAPAAGAVAATIAAVDRPADSAPRPIGIASLPSHGVVGATSVAIVGRPARGAAAVPSVAVQLHLARPAVAGGQDATLFPTFHTTAVADGEGRAIEFADAAFVRVPSASSVATARPAPPTKSASRTKSSSRADATSTVVPPTPADSTPVAVTSGGRGPADVPPPLSVVGAGLSDPTATDDAAGWTPSAGVQADGSDGAPGDLAWETLVNEAGMGSGGVRGVTRGGWTAGDGSFQDVIVAPDGSITVVPEPAALLGLALVGVLLRRRRTA